MTLSRGIIQVFESDGVRWKQCECGARFEVELNRKGQVTTRRLCDQCRPVRERLRRTQPVIPADNPRCVDCLGLVGLAWGAITHLDSAGRCSDCARWVAKPRPRPIKEAPVWPYPVVKIWPVPRPHKGRGGEAQNQPYGAERRMSAYWAGAI